MEQSICAQASDGDNWNDGLAICRELLIKRIHAGDAVLLLVEITPREAFRRSVRIRAGKRGFSAVSPAADCRAGDSTGIPQSCFKEECHIPGTHLHTVRNGPSS